MLTIKDGLYRVETSYLCAGFVVAGGVITECAPILRRSRGWLARAVWVGP